ncbi:MAG: YdcH family protein [Nitrospirae bacterium]|nr:YdcH family protein [Nitrospirota bacterium]MBF0591744.1 YdcH family protein [Nitrospirota bacterium]
MTEQQIVERLRSDNEHFRRLFEEHRLLDLKIDEMDKKLYLTTEEDLRRKEIQKEKLFKKDRIAEMIRQYKKMPDYSMAAGVSSEG